MGIKFPLLLFRHILAFFSFYYFYSLYIWQRGIKLKLKLEFWTFYGVISMVFKSVDHGQCGLCTITRKIYRRIRW